MSGRKAALPPDRRRLGPETLEDGSKQQMTSFLADILADLDRAENRFTIKPDGAKAFAELGIKPKGGRTVAFMSGRKTLRRYSPYGPASLAGQVSNGRDFRWK